jgi:ATP-dependent helicase HrpB
VPEPLPIDPLLPDVVATVRRHAAAVIEAPPGAGKTTRVPRALVEAGLPGEVVVLEPRRLPTRLAAKRVAEELGERPGDAVGYTVRFEDVGGPRTRLKFVTEGILARRLLADPDLRGVGCVVLDEFHERHLATDLALALLRRLQEGRRPDLKLLAMSATLEAGPIAAYLGDAPVLRSEGRRFEVVIEHDERPDAETRRLEERVAGAVKRLVREGLDGHVLVFLPGAAEIRRAAEALAPFAGEHDLAVLPLHGDLPAAEQSRAVDPDPRGRRKVILSTNVAETSVTIPDVAAVVDSGLARVAAYSPWTGLPTLATAKVSRASALQRAGRAGRTRAGRVLRLYSRLDFETRPERDAPEVARTDLAEAVLTLHGAGVRSPAAFDWFEPPPAAALGAAEELLRRLDAVGPDGALTAIGRRMLAFPTHPRLARMVVEGERRGVAGEAALLAALVGERDIRVRGPGGGPVYRETRSGAGAASGATAPGAADQEHPAGGSPSGRTARDSAASTGGRSPSPGATFSAESDLLELADLFREAERARFAAGRLRSLGLDPRSTEAVDRARRQLARLAKNTGPAPGNTAAAEEALCLAVLAGFPDRVARRRSRASREVVLSAGGSATLGEESAVHGAELLVAVDVEERSFGRGGARTTVRLASAIEPEWLLDLASDRLRDTTELVWNDAAGRVDQVSRLHYDSLVLEESVKPAAPSPEVARRLADAARARGLAAGGEELTRLQARAELVAHTLPASGVRPFGDAEIEAALLAACEGKRSLAELEGLSLADALLSLLPPGARETLRREAPDRVTLPGGRSLPVHYEPGAPPWIESRLQDFFGAAHGPAICAGRVPLTLHLNAPSGRAVQVTSDLAGFWERHYPAIRKELMRKYPKHLWPEDGRTAKPPTPGRIR